MFGHPPVPTLLLQFREQPPGNDTAHALSPNVKPTPAAYAISIGADLLGLGLYVWLRSVLGAHGYDFQGRF